MGRRPLILALLLLASACCHKPPACPDPANPRCGPQGCPALSGAWTDPDPAQATLDQMVDQLLTDVPAVLADPTFAPEETYGHCWRARVSAWSTLATTIQTQAAGARRFALGGAAGNVVVVLSGMDLESTRRDTSALRNALSDLRDAVKVPPEPPR